MNSILFGVIFLTSVMTVNTQLQAIEAEIGRGEIEEPTGPENPRDKNPSEFDPAHEGPQQPGNSVISPEPVGPTNGPGNRGNQPSQFTNTTALTESVDIVSDNLTTVQQSVNSATTITPQAQELLNTTISNFQTTLDATTQAINDYNPADPTTQQDLGNQVLKLQRLVRKLKGLQNQGVATDEIQTTLESATTLLNQLKPYENRVNVNEGGNTTQDIPIAKQPTLPKANFTPVDQVVKTMTELSEQSAGNKVPTLDDINNLTTKVVAMFDKSDSAEVGDFLGAYGKELVTYCTDQVDALQSYSPDEVSVNSDAIAKLLTNMKTIFNRMDMFTDVQKENGQAINQTRVTIDMLDIRQKVVQAQDNIKNHTMSQQTGSKIMNFLNNMQAAFGRMFGTASTKASVQDVVASARTVTDMCTEQIQAASQAMSGQVPTVTAIKEIAFYADIIEKQKQLLVDLKQELATMPIGQFALRQNIETAINQIEPSLKQSLTTIEDTVSSDQLVEWQGQLQKALQPVAPYSWLQDGTQFQQQPIMYTDPIPLLTFAKAIGLVGPNASNTQALAAFRAADINTLLNNIKTVTGQSAPTTVAQQIVRDMNGMLNASPDIVGVLKQLASPDVNVQNSAKQKIADGYQQYKQLQIAQFELADLSLPTN